MNAICCHNLSQQIIIADNLGSCHLSEPKLSREDNSKLQRNWIKQKQL